MVRETLNPQVLDTGGEAEALERNRELGDPSVSGAARADVPDGVPVGVQLSVGDQAVDERAGGIGGEVERAALIAEGVQDDLDAIIGKGYFRRGPSACR